LRLGKAKELLKSSNLKSSQIATEIGYNDSHYFSYIFKKNVGMTPSEYRSQYQNQPE
ncbi:MAG: helix-turn-helix transcriptional regulator, partial [Butyrivibrio sp.]|nr:helix-turn-helix transcriptional regulator [Butyrivibrio sp.]